jgi:hypothetical protein
MTTRRPFAFIGGLSRLGSSGLVWTSWGVPKLFTGANWNGVTWYFESYMRAVAGTVHSRAYNETDGTALTGSELSTTSATMVRQRSGALTPTNGKEYRAQFALGAGAAGEKQGGCLIGVPT